MRNNPDPMKKLAFIGRADFTQSGAELKPYKWWYGVINE